MSLIHVLDPHSANQIAAGEVVERPVSVVKELVENSLDSGAKNIDIVIEGNGVPLIKVRDDGCGIAPVDLPLAVLRHATSKISEIGDLDSLHSLGFRGEALPSIASVSRMEIISRPIDVAAGMSLKLEAGTQIEFQEAGTPPGTTVIIKDLFFNTPARLKFLRSNNTEFGLISDVIGRLALAHPEVRFTLAHPQQIVLQTSGRSQADALVSVLGLNLARGLQPISAQLNDWSLEGYISPPNLVRSSRQTQTIIINGRIIRSPLISKALEDGYHTLIAHRTYPIAVLHLRIPPDEYDVNVHPTKMEIRFRREKELASFITRTVSQALLAGRPIPSFDSAPAKISPQIPASPVFRSIPAEDTVTFSVSAPQAPNFQSSGLHQNQKEFLLHSSTTSAGEERGKDDSSSMTSVVSAGEESLAEGLTNRAPESAVPVQINLPLRTAPGAGWTLNESLPAYDHESTMESALSEAEMPESDKIFLQNIWPVGQVFNTYILATDGRVMAIIDQHAAHERINYEKFLHEVKTSPRLSQELLVPIPMEFSLEEEQILLDQLWFLTEMGFVLEQFGSRTYLLRSVPHHAGADSPEKLLREFINKVIAENIPAQFDQLLSEWIYMVACKASIKAKESLSVLEMEQLLHQLSQTENPFTCPHGRPTVIKLTRQELEKRFHRT